MDISRIAQIAHSHPSKPLLLVDNTFLSPFYSSPLLLGADVVLHSLTKYVNGHSDVVMGALILPPSSSSPRLRAFKDKLRFLQNATGAIPSPYDCWLAQRGAKTLGLRMRQHGLNALKIAKVLRSFPLVEEVMYPGLETNERYELAWRSLSSHARRWIEEDVLLRDLHHSSPSLSEPPEGGFPYSGMISFRLPSYQHAVTFLTSTRLFTLAESLGGVESLAEHPASMTHAGIPKEERDALGITEGLVRLSVGIEDIDDLVIDVREALEKCARVNV
jgi:cystathionine gamma-lyase